MWKKTDQNKKKYVTTYFDGSLKANRKAFRTSKILQKAYESAQDIKEESEKSYNESEHQANEAVS